MKKIIAAIAAVSMCAFMFASCGDKTTGTGDADITESITTEQAAGADDESSASDETEADKSDDSADDQTDIADDSDDSDSSETESGSSDAAASYASLDEFCNADDVFDHQAEAVDRDDTNTYAFNKEFEGATDIYVDLESIDGNMKIVMAMAMETKQIAIDIEGVVGESVDISNMSIIMTDGKMYMLDPSSKSGFFMAIDDEQLSDMFGKYDPEEILSEANIDTSLDFEGMMCYSVDIGGKSYTFEFLESTGMLYDASGKLCAIVSDDSDSEIRAILINEFSTNVSASAFDIPSGYEIIDMAEFLG